MKSLRTSHFLLLNWQLAPVISLCDTSHRGCWVEILDLGHITENRKPVLLIVRGKGKAFDILFWNIYIIIKDALGRSSFATGLPNPVLAHAICLLDCLVPYSSMLVKLKSYTSPDAGFAHDAYVQVNEHKICCNPFSKLLAKGLEKVVAFYHSCQHVYPLGSILMSQDSMSGSLK